MTEWGIANLAQSGAAGSIIGLLFLVLYIAIIVVAIMGSWKMHVKAGQPGWACIVPIYNLYVMTKMVNRPWWWMLLMLVPLVGLIVAIIMMLDLAKAFSKSTAFAVGLILLNPIFVAILGFGSAQYQPIARA